MSTALSSDPYPVRYHVEYPEGSRNRLTAAFRIVLVLPIFVVFILLGGSSNAIWQADGDRDRIEQRGPGDFGADAAPDARVAGLIVGAVALSAVFFPAAAAALIGNSASAAPLAGAVALMLIFRRKYPRWWYDFTLQVARFGGRVGAYAALQRDEYPSTDEEQAVHLEIDYPDAHQLNRWLPLVKWFLLIPHYIVLFFLYLGLIATTFIAWLAILVTGRYPRPLFEYAVGVARWATRVSGYGFFLVTDRYPPFSLR